MANLTEEDCKDAILQFANENCCFGTKPAKDMSITRVDGVTALHVSMSHILLTIMKTRLFKYIEILISKNRKFSDKKLIFSYFCLKHRLWVLLRTASSRRF